MPFFWLMIPRLVAPTEVAQPGRPVSVKLVEHADHESREIPAADRISQFGPNAPGIRQIVSEPPSRHQSEICLVLTDGVDNSLAVSGHDSKRGEQQGRAEYSVRLPFIAAEGYSYVH